MFNSTSNIAVESLEARALFSHGVPDPIVVDDRATIAAQHALISQHRHELTATLAADVAAMHEARHQRLLDSEPLRQKLNDDRTAGHQEILDDQSTLLLKLNDDHAAVRSLLHDIVLHHGDAAQLTIDRANLAAARATVITDAMAGHATIHQHRQELETELADDRSAIFSFMHTDSAGMTAAKQQFDDDKAAGEAELEDDRLALVDDMHKLHDDLAGHA